MTHRERDILQAAHNAGVTLTVDGDRLRYRASAGVMMPDLQAALRELKPTPLYEYHERAGILEYDAGFTKNEAETRAALQVTVFPALPCPGPLPPAQVLHGP